MSSDNDLLHQPNTLQQQPPLMKKKSNLIWIVTIIPLLITNLQYLDFLRSWYDRPSFLTSFLGTTPHLSALLGINLVAASFYLQKKSNPNWIIIFTFLVMCNLIFYGHMLSWITSPYLGLALVGAFPYLLILSVVDFIAVFNELPRSKLRGIKIV
jgi:hypothetical protein